MTTPSTKQASDAINKAVGVQLQSLRVYAGLDLDAAAQELRLDRAELAAFEAGAARPAPGSVLAMADRYRVPPSRVFAILTASVRA